MWEFWFHWTHDEVFKEVLKALIPAIGYMFVGAITWIGIWRTSKIAKQTLEDTREATPPELLRLEKWSTILKDTEQYPKNVDMGINTIYCTYKDVLKRATLENRIKNMAIWDSEVEDKLLKIKPNSGQGKYPKEEWGIQSIYRRSVIFRWIYIHIATQALIMFFFSALFIFTSREIFKFWFMAFVGISFITAIASMIGATITDNIYRKYKRKLPDALMKNIVYRNCYYALREVFLVDGLELVESPDERKEREKFEKTEKYKKWQEENLQLTSWNYGLSIDRDNNPEKDRTGKSAPETPTDLVGSESTPEDPKRQEP